MSKLDAARSSFYMGPKSDKLAPAMAVIVLTIEGELVGPMSIGTVAVIRAIEKHLSLPLSDAIELVERCVFEGKEFRLQAPTRAAAQGLLSEFSRLPAASRIHASIAD